MLINKDKTNSMIFNFLRNYQFTTRINLEHQNINVISQTKLLGTIVTDDLKWDQNTDYLVKKAHKRMALLRKIASFGTNIFELKNIYILFIRSILEFNCTVWNSNLSQKNVNDLERAQKCAVRILAGNTYKSYDDCLQKLDLETLENRRELLCSKFSKKILKNEKMKKMFPEAQKIHSMETRSTEKYIVNFAHTDRFKNSPVLYMQRLLNKMENEKN